MRQIMLSCLLCLPGLALADEPYFAHTQLPLSAQEKAALAIGQAWQTGSSTSKPVAGSDGAITFVYGSGQTQIDCAVLQVSDIALQAGEQINNINVGDPRFSIEPAMMGQGVRQTMHLLIKPLDVGLDTSLVVTTNLRTYHLRLRSFRHKFMPYVAFIYPEDLQAKWQAQAAQRADNTLPQTHEYLGDLDFHYRLQGNAPWKPVRVYNDGKKTIIEMPKALTQSEAPTLLIVLQAGGLFSAPKTAMVNYRVQGDRYIVDSVFQQALLIAGVGAGQTKITITKEA